MDSSVCIRNVPEDDSLKISFYHCGQQKDFSRKKNDTLAQTLNRIAIKLQPKVKKKKKAGTEEAVTVSGVVCRLLDDNVEVGGELSNEEGFLVGRILQINDAKYTIYMNPPTVSELSLPNYIMAGFPVIPKIKLEAAHIEASKFEWLKSSSQDSDISEWKSVSEEPSYVPDVSDIDFYLKCICYPGNGSVVGPFCKESISSESVKAGPGPCLFDERHLYTPDYNLPDSTDFRIITYNILANVFADTDYARTELFPFCPAYAIKSDYRRQLLFKELIGYHADLICLQECSLHEYDNYLYNWMLLHGYKGFLKLKLGEMNEGEAFFFRNNRYEHIADLSISVQEAFLLECNETILKNISYIPSLLGNIQSKKAVGQIHILKEKCGQERLICVLNTHLYYERQATLIRLLQLVILLNYLCDSLKHYEENIAVIISGDLNTLRGDPLLQYLLGEVIKEDHPVWSSCENCLHIDLTCPLKLKLLSGFPKFTSYVPHCKSTLDYILGDFAFVKDRFVPMPSASDIDIYTGVPCVVYPSDHLAVVLDLKWSGAS